MTIHMLQNKYGHLEIWKANTDSKMKTTHSRESDLYIQQDTDVENMMSNLTPDDKELVKNGYILTTEIDDLYFATN